MMRRSLTRFATIIAGHAEKPPKADEPVTLANASFLVSPDRLTREFERLMAGHTHIFLKGSLHEGKSSWAQSYAQLNPTTACYIPCNEGVGGVQKMCDCIVKYYNKHVRDNCKKSGPPKGQWRIDLPRIESLSNLCGLSEDFTLLFDECHELFSLPWDSAPFEQFVERASLNCRVVYLGTTQYGTSTSRGTVTRPQIDNKWILPWRFTREEVAKLIPCMLHGRLNPPSKVDDATADLLFGLLKGHRGMTMMTLEAIRQRQVVDGVPAVGSDRELCSIFQEYVGPIIGRANLIDSPARTFPDGFGHNMEVLTQCALASGKISKEIAGRAFSDIQHGVRLGVFSPLEMCGGYDKATEVVDSPDYAISNPVLRSNLEQSMGPRPWPFCTVDLPELPVDAIVTAFACMPDNLFLKCGGSCTTRKSAVWYADPINEAIRASFNRVYNLTTSLVVGAPTSAAGVGKVDFVCGNFRIENVVYENASQVESHYRRWHDVAEYKAGLAAKHPSLLVVCCRPDQAGEVKEIVKCSLFGECNPFSSFNELVPVLIVEIDWSLLWQFSVTYMEKKHNDGGNPATRETTAVIPRNLQPWKFDAITRKFVSASRPSATLQSELDGLKQFVPEGPVRVRVLISRQPGKYDALRESDDVRPALNLHDLGDTVDAMRYAVKDYILPDELRRYDVDDLRVYPPGTTEFVSKNELGVNAYRGPISTRLVPTMKDPYVIVALNPRLFPVRVRVLISRQPGKDDIVGESDVRPVLNEYYHGDTMDTMRHAVKDYILRDKLRLYDVYHLKVYPPGTTEFVSKNEYGADGGPGPISTPLVPTTKDPYVIVAVNPRLFPVRVRLLISHQPGKYDIVGEKEADVRPFLSQHHLVDTVDAMRHAVKDYMKSDELCLYDVYHLKVYPPGTTEFVSTNEYGADGGPGPISTPLVPTTNDPYVIVAVNPNLFPVRVRVLISRQPGKHDDLLCGDTDKYELVGSADVRLVLEKHSLFCTVEEMRRVVRAYLFPEELRHYDLNDLKVYPPGTTEFVSKNEYGAGGRPGPTSTPLVPTTKDPYVIVANPKLFPVRVRLLISRQPGKYDVVGESDVRAVLNEYNLCDTVDAMRKAARAYISQDELHLYDLRVYPPGTTEFVSKNEYGANANPGPIPTPLSTKDPYVIVAVKRVFPVRVRVLISRQPDKCELVGDVDVRPVLSQHYSLVTVDAMRRAVKDNIFPDELRQYDVDDLKVYPPGTTEFISKNEYGADGGPGPISTPLVPTKTYPYVYTIDAMNPKFFPVSVRVLISLQPGKYDTLLEESDDVRPVLNMYYLGGTVDTMRRAVKAYILRDELRQYDVDDLKVYRPGTTKFISKNEYGADGGPGPISSPLVPATKHPYMIVVTERCLVSGTTQNSATTSSEMKEK